ncbi:hypothetical protein N7579_04920 [Acinetobacter ursingii]|uniref:DUF7666 domain-containing protein n=1 Tax=Acinetobacter ursingii TaxID=108980 RepID=UPI002448E41E|nr:hypothetical protein [Acinetobacter ursingii]MDH0006599.1 hypothetical protein [Acinetobacter ursingii]
MAKSKKKEVVETPIAVPVETITSFKGFDKNLICRNFQYEMGKTYTHDGDVKACGSGFHACEYPLDVLGYYPPSQSRYAVVEQSGDLSREENGDTKVASRSISLKFEISIADLVKFAIDYTLNRCQPIDKKSPSYSAAERGLASATGEYGAASATGYQGAASATGYQGAASATGNRGAASATGYQGAASATGNRGAASATGEYGAASATGNHAVACGLGWSNKAKASASGAIVLTHRNYGDEIVHIRASKVGENGIKPDTWYQLDENGEFVELEDEE